MSQAKPRTGLNMATRVTLLILLAFLTLFLPGWMLVVFVPVTGWYLWRLHDRVVQLEAKQGEPSKKSEGS